MNEVQRLKFMDILRITDRNDSDTIEKKDTWKYHRKINKFKS